MDLTERQLSRETIYEGKILHIYRDDVLLPNGGTSVREVAEHPGGVAIVALDENDTVLTEKQYRYVFSRVHAEIPAGKLPRREAPEQAAPPRCCTFNWPRGCPAVPLILQWPRF